MIRDAMQGERRVKERGTLYLPALARDGGTTYEDYKSRASFVNMTGRTIQGLLGTVFRRPVKVDNVNKKYLENVTLDGLDFNIFCKKATIEVIAMGRIGVLVDMDADGNQPYLIEYIAENILSWKTKIVNGRKVPVYVLLREIVDATPILDSDGSTAGGITISSYSLNLTARYRVLFLDQEGIYRQTIFKEQQLRDPYGNVTTILVQDGVTITPTKGGVPFNHIPMVVIGPLQPGFEVQRSPVLDITFLNMAHYRTSAQLEHGRYFTALPVYWVPTKGQDEEAEYLIGPSVVWEVPEGTKPGILEYFGAGLKNLADSMVEKEMHISQLGGRIMGIAPAAASEHADVAKMKNANELSVLINITQSLSAGMTTAMKWLLDWQRVSNANVLVRFNQDFNALQIAARELRAIAVMYQAGILPMSEVFRVLQDSGFIDDTLSLQDFESTLANVKLSFPNQPDVEAMHEGYPNMAAKLADDRAQAQIDSSEREAELKRQHQLLVDERKAQQRGDLQEEAFQQGLTTAHFEKEQELALAAALLKQNVQVEIAKAGVALPPPAPKPGAPAKPAPNPKAGVKVAKAASKSAPKGNPFPTSGKPVASAPAAKPRPVTKPKLK